jgi:hypothetical protein
MIDACSAQRIMIVTDTQARSNEVAILKRELGMLSQIVKDQGVRMSILEKEFDSFKQTHGLCK